MYRQSGTLSPAAGDKGKQLSQGGDKFRADLRMAGESVAGIGILHPRKDILFFQETSTLRSERGVLGI